MAKKTFKATLGARGNEALIQMLLAGTKHP